MSSVYEIVTNIVVESLSKGVIPWKKPWSGDFAVPTNAITQRPYRGINAFLLAGAPYADTRWLTPKQANDRGGRIKAGERSALIVFWKHPERPSSGDELSDREEALRGPVLRYFRIFNAEQCEGLNLPPLCQAIEEQEPVRIARAELLATSMPDPPEMRLGASAWYRPSDDLVQMPPISRFDRVDSYYATLFHELAHATGHQRRLNRSGVTGNTPFGSGTYGKEELVAELASAFCCATVSLDNSVIENASAYINGWLKVLRADPKAVVIAAAQAQKAADFIRNVKFST